MSNLAKKTIKQITKPLQKIRQACKHIYKAKIQTSKHINQHTTVQCGCVHTMQTAEMQTSTKLEYSFGNYKQIKNSNNAGKKPDTSQKFRQNDCACAIMHCVSESA